MFRKLFILFCLLTVAVSCGEPPKTASSRKKGSSKKYSYQDREANPADQESIEDLIYSELSKRQQSLLKKYSIPTTSHSLGGVKYDIPVVMNDRVRNWIDYFVNGSGRKHYARYLARSTRVVPIQLRILKEHRAPKDLIFLSMMESGFNTHAYSSAAAVGLWQFIKSTGRLYGLENDYWIDERRDIEKASHAAARHLKDLYEEFGDWYLAFAAYNAGAGKVRRAIEGVGSRNFWDLASSSYLRQETKDYVPKILAATIIGKSPEKYGFTDVEYQDPIPTEKATVSSSTDLEVVAQCAGVDYNLIRLINPELIRNVTPPNRPQYTINVPRGTRATFERRYAKLDPSERLKGGTPTLNDALDTGTVATYATTSKGGRRLVDLISEKEDSDLSVKGKKDKKIAKKAAAPAPEEKNDNDGEMKVAWKEKPQAEKSAKPQTDLDSSIKSDPEYRSRLTEASDLQPAKEEGAKAEKTDLAMIEKTPSPKSDLPPDLAGGQNSESSPKSAENTNVDDRINKALGQVGAEKSDVATADDSEGAVRVKSSWEDPKTAKKDLKSKKEKSAPVAKSHLVKKGETLASIAEKYGVSIADLRSWNKMSPKKELLWGQKLKIETASSNKEAEEPSDNKFAKAPQNKAITTKTEKNEKSLKTAKAPAAKVIAYKVKKGDTINKIAKRYDLTPHEILGFNGIKNGAIRPGLVLKIPASKSKG